MSSDHSPRFRRRYFVLSPRFHGATLLARLLNSHPDVACLADTYPNSEFDQVCGCGMPIRSCDFWQQTRALIRLAKGRKLHDWPLTYPPIVGSSLVDRLIYNAFPPKLLSRTVPASRLAEFRLEYESFVDAVYQHYEKEPRPVFVDGVKSIARVKALVAAGGQVDGVIHLYRDPTAFVKSTMKQDGNNLGTLAVAALSWRFYHRQASQLRDYAPYMDISYEQLCADTDVVLDTIFRFFGTHAMKTDELRAAPEHAWHFIGNASLNNFDWTITANEYPNLQYSDVLINYLAGKKR